MRGASNFLKTLIWIFTVLYMALQGLAVYALSMNNDNYNVLPLAGVSVLMLTGVILFMVLTKRRSIGMIVAFVAAIGMLVVALDLGRQFPVSIGSSDTDYGLSLWKLIWRHYGIAIIPVLMLPAWLCERAANKADEMANMLYKPKYDLSGGAIFSDGDDVLADENKKPRLKRSIRKRIEKLEQAERLRRESMPQ